jgi:hypothetical protein
VPRPIDALPAPFDALPAEIRQAIQHLADHARNRDWALVQDYARWIEAAAANQHR